jgi:hypothetical protein
LFLDALARVTTLMPTASPNSAPRSSQNHGC